MGGGERFLHRPAPAMRRADMLDHAVEELAGLFDRGVRLVRPAGDRAAPADEIFRAISLDPVERAGGPFAVEGIAGVKRSLRLDQIACEQGAAPLVPGDDIPGGVAASAKGEIEPRSPPRSMR